MRPIRYVLDDCSHVYVALFPGELRLSFELFDWLSWFPRTGGQDQLGGSEGLAQSILLDQVSYRHFNFTEGRGPKFQLLDSSIESLTISVPKNYGQSFR